MFFLSFAPEISNFPLFNVSLDMVVGTDRATTRGTTREEEVAGLERKPPADETYCLVDREEHVGSATLLHRIAVDVETEPQSVDLRQLVLVDPFADDRRVVEALAALPRQSLSPETCLQLARREVDTDGERVVVAVRKPYRNGFP